MAEKPSGQRTEKPTPKRLREARRKGQIPRSPDLVGWAALLAATYVIPPVLGMMQARFLDYFRRTVEALANGRFEMALLASRELVTGVSLIFLPFLLILVVITALGLAVQGGVTLSAEPLRPKFERISPKAGVKRLVSAQSAVDTAKARGITTVGLLGKGGGELLDRVDVSIVVPLATTSDRIQEVHIKVIHIVIEAVERRLFPDNYSGS